MLEMREEDKTVLEEATRGVAERLDAHEVRYDVTQYDELGFLFKVEGFTFMFVPVSLKGGKGSLRFVPTDDEPMNAQALQKAIDSAWERVHGIINEDLGVAVSSWSNACRSYERMKKEREREIRRVAKEFKAGMAFESISKYNFAKHRIEIIVVATGSAIIDMDGLYTRSIRKSILAGKVVDGEYKPL